MLLIDMDNSVNHHSPRRRISDGSSSVKDKPIRVDPRTTSSSTRLRSNLLRKLGIPPSKQQQQQYPIGVKHPPRDLLANVKVQRMPLKTDEMDKNIISGRCHSDTVLQAWGSLFTKQQQQSSSPSDRSATSRTSIVSMSQSDDSARHVRFDPDVQVALIPTRHEYSRRIAQFLWDSPQNMRSSIVRNTLEFTADGWDWNTVATEEEHYYNPKTGEYIHPVHLEIAQMPPEEQEHICPANYVNPALVTYGPPSMATTAPWH